MLELKKIIYSKKSIILISILSILILSESIEIILFFDNLSLRDSIFLASSTEGHIQISLLCYLYPLFFIGIMADRVFEENQSSLVFFMVSDKKMYLKRIIKSIAILVSTYFVIMFTMDVLINLIRVISFDGDLYFLANPDSEYFHLTYLTYTYPFPYLLFTYFNAILYFTLFSILIALLANIIKDIKTLHLSTFLVNLIFMINSKFAVMRLIFPYGDITQEAYLLIAIVVPLALMVLISVAYMYATKGRDYV